MNRITRPIIVTLCVIAILATAPAAFADARGSFTKTLTVSGAPEVDVTTGSGNITVNTGNASTVSVRATITANDRWFSSDSISAEEKVKRIEQNPPVEQNGNIITIGKITDRDLRNNVSITYDITLPAASKLRAQTGSGDQFISGVNGTVKLSTGSGNVTAKQIGDETRISTGSGEIRVDNVKGRVYASAGSGNVQAHGIAGGFYGETGSGDISYEQTAPGSVTAKTGSGNIRLRNVIGGVEAHTGSGDIEADGDVKSDWQAGSGSGNINLRLPKDAAFNLDARSSSGSVTVDHPVTTQGAMKRNRIQGKVGAGGMLVSLESGSGDIHIK
ncbi:MAG TPA: DUF4097 family beta strand repeat-containing protein [Terriglobales bacterium]|nr:DUF4097 family beta strand repeat-containing protein [Terriglobales bacterium]